MVIPPPTTMLIQHHSKDVSSAGSFDSVNIAYKGCKSRFTKVSSRYMPNEAAPIQFTILPAVICKWILCVNKYLIIIKAKIAVK